MLLSKLRTAFAPTAIVLVAALSWSTVSRAEDAGELPAYILDQFGQPPTVPDGPLTEAQQAAVQVAFVDSVSQRTWGAEQDAALATIADSGDPRLVWMISDLMRFSPGPGLTTSLAGPHPGS